MNHDANNEVVKLRELLNRAIEIAEDFLSNGHDTACYYEVNKYRCRCGFIDTSDELDKIKAEARLAPAPEEPKTSANPDKCIGNVTKFTHEGNTDAKFKQCEWRELGPDEVIQAGDECRWISEPQYEPVMDSTIGADSSAFKFYRFRTRRPLPKQEEMPLEKELDYLTREASRASDIHNHVLIVDCLRYLRDEIHKLKEAR